MKSGKDIPPRFAQQTLLRFLRADLAEEVLGDLDEKFYSMRHKRSPLRAKLNYWYQVFNYLRPFAIRKSSSVHSNHSAMFQSYFKIGYRNLFRNKGYSMINIGGLAVGMAVAILIGLWIFDELSYNRYHTNYERVVQVMQHQTFNGVKGTQRSIPRPLENVLRTHFASDFQHLSMATWTGDHILSFGEHKITKPGNYFQSGFPEMLSLKMVKGTRNVLDDPTSILLSESTAKALFGDIDPLNQQVRIDNRHDVKVMGIYEDLPHNTSFKELHFMASWELYITAVDWVKEAVDQWGNNSFQLYAQLAPHANLVQVSEKIKNVKAESDKSEAIFKPEMFLHPMKDWHLRSDWKEGKNIGGRIQMVWLFGIIGIFVLLLACINFMNLSTARSEKRAKEVGIRMTVGSVRRQLINQFLSESFLVVLLAFVLAAGIVLVSLPWFNDLAGKKISIAWSSPFFWLINMAFIVITSFLAGSYPALYLSSFQPVKVLKGTFKGGRYASVPRKVLVVVQFSVSVMLIIGTIIVHRQIEFTKNRPIGYERDRLIMIHMKSPDFYETGKYDVLREALKNAGAIEELSESSSPVTGVWSNNGGFNWEGKDPALQTEFATIWVSHEYGKTIGWEVLAGRDFSREFATDTSAIILNEAALKFMNIEDPVGMEIKWNDRNLRVIGVIKDMVMESPYSPVRQAVYVVNYENVNWINLKLSPAKSTGESLAIIESVFKTHIPSAPFEYKFVDEEYARKFEAEVRMGRLASIFAVLAVFISCLGIFGLASFVAEQRTKEIGIRKVLGASVANLWRLLSKDFVLLVIISCIIAIPVAYYLLLNWLEKYQYHTEISWWILVVAGIGTLIITLLTVSFQAIRAALMSPVKSLKSE